MNRRLSVQILGVLSSAAIAASGVSKIILGEIAGVSIETQRVAWFIVFGIGLVCGLSGIYLHRRRTQITP